MSEKVKIKTKEPARKDAPDELQRELEDSFPASDPPSITQSELKPGHPERKMNRGAKKE